MSTVSTDESNQMEKSTKNKFRCQGTAFLLTYPKCTLSKEEVLQDLQNLLQVKTYTIASELHADGSPHIHAVLQLGARLNTTNPRYFDVRGFHPNIKKLSFGRDIQKATEYAKKDGSFISTFEEPVSKRLALAQDILTEGRITPSLIKKNPLILFLNHSQISSWLNVCFPANHLPPPRILPKRRHLWCYGASNTGKSYYLNAFMLLFFQPVQGPDNNDWTAASSETDLIFFDEFKGSVTVQTINRLCDGRLQVNKKGGSVFLAYPLIYVASNYHPAQVYKKAISEDPEILVTIKNRFILYCFDKLDRYPDQVLSKDKFHFPSCEL